MLMENERGLIVDYGKKASATGLCKGTAGNISIFDSDTGLMVIKPSGLGYYETEVSDVVVMKLDGTIVEGERKPSSEWAMHAAFYKARPNARSVVHTHQPYCTTFACMQMPIRAVHYVIAGSGGSEIPCSEYATFGTEQLAENAIAALGEGNAVLLANHGLITCGSNIQKAFSLANNLEFCAEMQWRCMAIGKPVILNEEQMRDVMEGFKSYGQPKKANAAEHNSY